MRWRRRRRTPRAGRRARWSAWPARRPHRHAHFTPINPSWLNLVERFFVELAERRIKRGAHRSVKEPEDAIATQIETHNDDPKPFTCSRSADQILDAVKRYCQRPTPTTCDAKS